MKSKIKQERFCLFILSKSFFPIYFLSMYKMCCYSRHFFLINYNRTVAFAVTTTSSSLFFFFFVFFSREDLRILSKHKTFSLSLSVSVSVPVSLSSWAAQKSLYFLLVPMNEWTCVNLRVCAPIILPGDVISSMHSIYQQ